MNYIREVNAFYNWLRWNPCGTSEIVLWHAVMQAANQQSWPQDFTITNQTLYSMTGLGRNALNDARNKLCQKKRLWYRKGRGNQTGTYSIVPFDGNMKDAHADAHPAHMQTHIPHKHKANADAPYIQNSINLNINKTKTSPYRPPVGELFDRFWEAYPRHVGKDPARKAFVKLQPDEALLEEMLTAMQRQKQSEQWQRDNGQYIPYPATWLNQHRWEDEEDIAIAKPKKPTSFDLDAYEQQVSRFTPVYRKREDKP